MSAVCSCREDLLSLEWRPIFLIDVRLGIATLVAAARIVPGSRAERADGLAFTGVGLVTAGLVLLLYPLVQGRELDRPTWTLVSMAASLPATALVAWHQRRGGRQLWPPRSLASLPSVGEPAGAPQHGPSRM